MTAPGATAPQPGRATQVGHPVRALWPLLLVGLLALLPCAGRAQAVTAKPLPSTATTVAGPTVLTAHTVQSAQAGTARPAHHRGATSAIADAGLPHTWCSVDGEPPRQGDGCSNHPFCGAESQLPNAPPQPAATVPAQLVLERALPRLAPLTTLVGPDLAPDLHALQVHRT